jgi:serine/threonine-protein kinase RsbW
MPMAMNLELVLPRDTATVPLVRHLLKHTLVEFGVSPECVSDVEVAVTEACANVVEHASGDDEYEVRTSLTDELCEIRVVDTGRGFDHESMNARTFDQASERGRGLLLMQALVDNIRFESEPEVGTVVHLTKRLQFESAPLRRATPPPSHGSVPR